MNALVRSVAASLPPDQRRKLATEIKLDYWREKMGYRWRNRSLNRSVEDRRDWAKTRALERRCTRLIRIAEVPR